MGNTRPRGWVAIREEECKGCGLCIAVCPDNALELSSRLNHQGYHPVRFKPDSCRADSHCFYACPEPGAITVFRGDSRERRAA